MNGLYFGPERGVALWALLPVQPTDHLFNEFDRPSNRVQCYGLLFLKQCLVEIYTIGEDGEVVYFYFTLTTFHNFYFILLFNYSNRARYKWSHTISGISLSEFISNYKLNHTPKTSLSDKSWTKRACKFLKQENKVKV